MKFVLPPDTPVGQHNAIMEDAKLLTVSAGAGSGKTWVLSNRYTRLLLEDKDLKPNEILTLTFTEAAAGEMNTRIEALVRHELEKFEDSGRKQEILEGLSDLWISTIHSFAARLIRESGLSLDIDPRASVITVHQIREFWDNITSALEFSNLKDLARHYGDKTLKELAKLLDDDKYLSASVNKWHSETLSKLAQDTIELHASAGRTWQDMLKWAENDSLIESAKPLVKDILKDEWQYVWDIWKDIYLSPDTKSEGPGANLKALLDWQKYHLSYYDEENLRYFYEAIVIDAAKNIKGTSGEPFKSLKNVFKMTFGDWRKSRPDLFKVVTQSFGKEFSEQELIMRKTLLKFCALCWGMWDRMRNSRGLLTFSDMILHAKTAISNGGIDRNFKHILIDEFQDTDFLQFDMIRSLSDSTNLFAVGDPKQSIYGFRHADPSLFADTIDKSDKKVSLDVSFRTRYALLSELNKIFKSLWCNGLGRSPSMRKLGYEDLHSISLDPDRDNGTMPPFKIFLARHNSKTVKDAKVTLAENLAKQIYSWIKEGRTIWDKKERFIRPVKNSDFAVLSRSRAIYPVLEEAFGKFGIKTIEDRSNDFFSRGEVNDAVCMLRAIVDENDTFALTGWLLSPFSGVDEEKALEALTLVNESYTTLQLIQDKFPEAYSRLEYLALVGENEGAAGLLALFDKERQWLSCYDDVDRLRVLRNLREALSITQGFQASGTASLAACAEYLMRSVQNEISVEEPEWNDENENAVKLGVVHSAKGLEYPVTIIFDYRTQVNNDYGLLAPSKELGVVFSNLPDEVPLTSSSKLYANDWNKLLSRETDLEEETRLFYVAATRAQDSLIFCGLVNEDDIPHKNTWTKLLLDNFKTFAPEYVEQLEEDEFPEIEIDDEEIVLLPLNIVHAKNSLRQISATSFALFEWCPYAWRRKYRQGLELSWENEKFYNGDEDFSGGADVGSLTHWILSRWPRKNDYEAELQHLLYDREILGRLPGLLRRPWREKSNKENIYKWLMNFAASERGKSLMYNKKVKREYKFMVRLDQDTNLAGSIDALHDNNVIDYKITSVDNAPKKLYEAQLEFYAYVVHELTRVESVNTCAAFLREGNFVDNVCNNFDEIKARITNAAEVCVSGPHNPNVNNCALCPFKKGCVKNAERL